MGDLSADKEQNCKDNGINQGYPELCQRAPYSESHGDGLPPLKSQEGRKDMSQYGCKGHRNHFHPLNGVILQQKYKRKITFQKIQHNAGQSQLIPRCMP